MNHFKRKFAIVLSASLGILILAALLIYLAVDFLVDLWWFGEINRSGLFILRTFYRDIIGFGITLIFGAIIYTNFWVVSKISKRMGLAADAAAPQTIRGRLIHAVAGGSPKIVLSHNIAPESRLLMRRNIRECIAAITPFLVLDDDPYPVLKEQRIFWVQDAYTVSDRFLILPIR